MKKMISILIGSILVISCDPGVINNYVIENKSNYSIKTEIILKSEYRKLNSSDTTKKILIKPNSEIKVIDYGEIGNACDQKEDFLDAFDSFIVHIDGMKISKKIIDRKNWKFAIKNKGLLSMDEVEYKFIIRNGDIHENNEN